ncbi:MAG: hypothetical protein KC413_21635, partial [Anaerolineales bacterium]|nr:hypothetical protein [Anaerolineales bacterium]
FVFAGSGGLFVDEFLQSFLLLMAKDAEHLKIDAEHLEKDARHLRKGAEHLGKDAEDWVCLQFGMAKEASIVVWWVA